MSTKLMRYIPFGGAILIGLGVLKYSTYYDYFGVNIMQYLSTSEVLTLFLNDYQSIIVITILIFIHLGFSLGITEKIEGKVDERLFNMFISSQKKWYVLFFLFIWSILTGLIYFQYISLNDFWIYLYVFIFASLIAFLFMQKGTLSMKFHFEKLFYIIVYILLLSVIPLMSLKDIRTVDNRQFQKAIHLEFYDGSHIKSDNNFVYLGKAGEYHFFYDYPGKTSKIIKSEDVKTVNIQFINDN